MTEELLCLLDERLTQHNNNRKEIQDKIQEICAKIVEEADSLEKEIDEQLQKRADLEDDKLLSLIDNLNNISERENSIESLIKQAQQELSREPKYAIQRDYRKDFAHSYELKISLVRIDVNIENERDIGVIINKLKEHLNRIHDSIRAAHDEISELCTLRRNYAKKLYESINGNLESLYNTEDSRLQKYVGLLKENIDNENIEELKVKAKATLLKIQRYSLDKNNILVVTKEANLNNINFEERKPLSKTVTSTDKNELLFSITFFNDIEINILKELKISSFTANIKMWEKSKSEEENAITVEKVYSLEELTTSFIGSFLFSDTPYYFRLKINYYIFSSKWSDIYEFTTLKFNNCIWKECPDDVDCSKKYSVGENNTRIAIHDGYREYCTIIGNIPLSLNKITLWNIKVLKSCRNNGDGIYIGVAPCDIDQNSNYDFNKYGWYLCCYNSSLHSGTPHNYKNNAYGPRKDYGDYVHEGDNVGVVMDTTKGELSFVLGGVNLGIAYEGIPLDKPLVPCVLLYYRNDSVELII